MAAKKYIGTEYKWGGRLTKKLPGLDCLGLIFRSIQDVTGKSWKVWSVYPSRLIKQIGSESEVLFIDNKELTDGLDEGDILFFLSGSKNDDEAVAYDRDNNPMYVWHTAIYAGSGNIIHSSPFADESGKRANRVLIEPLISFMKRVAFAGFVKTRFDKNSKTGKSD